jgi:hypothetical protein
LSYYVMVDGVIQKRTPEVDRWARRSAQHVPSSRVISELVESQAVPVYAPERKADERAERTAYRQLEALEETE